MPTIPPITDWSTLIEQIRQRPGMFLGHVTLRGLAHFLNGWKSAEWRYEIPPARCVVDAALDEFEEWAADRFNPTRMTIRSSELAFREAGSDEAAFWPWFDWYDRFRRDQGRG